MSVTPFSSSSVRLKHSTDLVDLPEDVFSLILDSLEIWEIFRCQIVSKQWQNAFSQDRYLEHACKRYPRVREMRQLQDLKLGTSKVSLCDWRTCARNIATRYFHLTKAKVYSISKYRLQAIDQAGHWVSIGQWDYHESQPGGRLYPEHVTQHLTTLGGKPYLFPPTLWSYDDGLVVFAPSMTIAVESSALQVLDVVTHRRYPVPFSISGKVIRNLKLKEHVLIIEWAEKLAYHDLNAAEKVHRHFATCFDLIKSTLDSGLVDGWDVHFRSEWKIHFLGLPLSSRDRFFSTHTKEHYAIYLWQPNRSMYTGDEDLPIEGLFVWDIHKPCAYLPSLDPTGKARPPEEAGPHMISRFSFRELEFIGVRQHANIRFMSLSLDSDARSLAVHENVCENGQGYFDPAERLWRTTTTTFPFDGEGPCFQQVKYDGGMPPYRGHCSMESATIEEAEAWFLPITDVWDEAADVRFSLVETCFTGLMMENRILLRIKALGNWRTLPDDVTRQVGVMGRIAGDERWIVGQNSQMELVIAKFQ